VPQILKGRKETEERIHKPDEYNLELNETYT